VTVGRNRSRFGRNRDGLTLQGNRWLGYRGVRLGGESQLSFRIFLLFARTWRPLRRRSGHALRLRASDLFSIPYSKIQAKIANIFD
jgi:hypothetical protein